MEEEAEQASDESEEALQQEADLEEDAGEELGDESDESFAQHSVDGTDEAWQQRREEGDDERGDGGKEEAQQVYDARKEAALANAAQRADGCGDRDERFVAAADLPQHLDDGGLVPKLDYIARRTEPEKKAKAATLYLSAEELGSSQLD